MALHQPAASSYDVGRLLIWLGAALIAVAVLVGVVVLFGDNVAAPAAPQSAAQELIIPGTNGGAIRYTGIPYPAPQPGYVIQGTNGGGLIYTGIPYPAPR